MYVQQPQYAQQVSESTGFCVRERPWARSGCAVLCRDLASRLVLACSSALCSPSTHSSRNTIRINRCSSRSRSGRKHSAGSHCPQRDRSGRLTSLRLVFLFFCFSFSSRSMDRNRCINNSRCIAKRSAGPLFSPSLPSASLPSLRPLLSARLPELLVHAGFSLPVPFSCLPCSTTPNRRSSLRLGCRTALSTLARMPFPCAVFLSSLCARSSPLATQYSIEHCTFETISARSDIDRDIDVAVQLRARRRIRRSEFKRGSPN